MKRKDRMLKSFGEKVRRGYFTEKVIDKVLEEMEMQKN